MCLSCRSFLKTYNNDKVLLFLNDDGEIEAYGEKINRENNTKIYY